MTIVLTACSNRKRVAASADLQARTLDVGNLAAVSTAWVSRLRQDHLEAPAWRVYCGRSFLEAHAAALVLGADLVIASAGLGLVTAERHIPGYGLTVITGAADTVLDRITPRADAASWWNAVTGDSPYHEALTSLIAEEGVILVALPTAYLQMLGGTLTALAAPARARLRIITGAEADAVPTALRVQVMPYDDRMDGPDSDRPGTRSDFVGRAARHFAEVVLMTDPGGDVAAHRAAVAERLNTWRRPAVPSRTRKTDDEILTLLRLHWAAAGGRSAKLLRILRDDLGVACEQSRFADLARRIRQEPGPQ